VHLFSLLEFIQWYNIPLNKFYYIIIIRLYLHMHQKLLLIISLENVK